MGLSSCLPRKVFVCPVMERVREGLGFNSHAPESARRFQRDLGQCTAIIGYWQTSDEIVRTVDVLVVLEHGDW
jgi:hypothetical protein